MASPWYDFLEEVRGARDKLGNPTVVWYRGHSSSQWNLIPGLHRSPGFSSKEQALFAEFQKSAARLFRKPDNDWETLFDMQHYGIPTRLLDWTEALGVALAFAVLDHHPSYGNPALWVLDPAGLNRKSGLVGVKTVPSDAFDYKAVYWKNVPFAANFPIAIDSSSLPNDRMSVQKGTFTVHGIDGRAIEEVCPDVIVKIELPQSALDGAREFLDYAAINSFAIYPDIVGMARHIRRKHLGE